MDFRRIKGICVFLLGHHVICECSLQKLVNYIGIKEMYVRSLRKKKFGQLCDNEVMDC